MVAQLRKWLPDPIGGILWFGVDDSYSTGLYPNVLWYIQGAGKLCHGNSSIMHFSDSAAFWVFNQVSNFAYTRYDMMMPFIRKKPAALEKKYISEVHNEDKKAVALYAKDPDKAIKLLTSFSDSKGDSTVEQWKDLYHFLFTRFVDGSVKTVVPGQPLPKVEQPGYGKAWYQKLVGNTGNEFLEKSQ